ncbi:MAG: hypothetical protein IKD93_06325 [Firmicutes bacterium]|nr:hypothetical protein [Bacillota bacterium]
MTRISCEICGGQLESVGGGRFVCRNCGLAYSRKRLQELAQAAEDPAPEMEEDTASETAAADSETPPVDSEAPAENEAPADRLAELEKEQRRLLAEISLADGVFGPARRRELSRELRKVEREMARLQGRKLPFFFR